MRRAVHGDAPDGVYFVAYRACWPDGYCHDGQLSFEIHRDALSEYQDFRGHAEVAVNMENIEFQPAQIIVSPGTRILWVNKDDAEHFVNTDPHPSHTYYPAQNSLGISLGDTFSVTLDKPGEYPYHCSAHYPQGMIGSVVVAE
jgi:plastocyanin